MWLAFRSGPPSPTFTNSHKAQIQWPHYKKIHIMAKTKTISKTPRRLCSFTTGSCLPLSGSRNQCQQLITNPCGLGCIRQGPPYYISTLPTGPPPKRTPALFCLLTPINPTVIQRHVVSRRCWAETGGPIRERPTEAQARIPILQKAK